MIFFILCEGSPPRVREGLLLIPSPNFSAGITPACAGRTTHALVYLEHRRDHPRVCGKDYKTLPHFSICIGSPPRVREGLSASIPL